MVLEQELLPYWVWLSASAAPFFVALIGVIGLGLLIGFLSVTFRRGPVAAIAAVFGGIWTAFRELMETSPRRLYAIARLAFQESIRRRVLVVFVVFVIALLFAGWFLDRDSDHPARLYLSFVLTATNYLVLLLAIFISAFSLPNDLKTKTIFTVVTKPVRGWEIVVGRMLGFVAIGTILLGLMCLFSYFFVVRGLQHAHSANPATLTRAAAGADDADALTGETSISHTHRHDVTIGADGNAVVDPARDHTHPLTGTPDSTRAGVYEFGKARGMLTARVPIRGDLRFLDERGNPSEGINVGYEWAYRKYIEGGTLAAAIWRFTDLKETNFGDTLPLEMSLRVFRTYKGNIEQGIRGTIELVRPAKLDADGNVTVPELRTSEVSFTVREYQAYQPQIPRKLEARDPATGETRVVDVFDDLIDPETGELEVWIRCLDRQQYLGMASADLYLRAKNQPFWLNFVKGYVSIWFQMVVVTCLGVTCSTFLSGPVAMIATLSALIMGMFKHFVTDVATGEMPGGGPVESLVRIIKQWNQMAELERGLGTWLIRKVDSALMLFVQGISQAMPDTTVFNTSKFVAYGFDVPNNLMAQHVTIMAAYVLVISAAGYFMFKSREIAA